MTRSARLVLLSLLAVLLVPAAAQAASVTVSNGTITFNAGAGETNTAVIVKQTTTAVATVYFVGDQNPAVTVTASALQGCVPTPAALGLPKGFLCTVSLLTPITSVVENLGDGNDTGVIRTASSGPPGLINGGTGNDTLVGGTENDTFRGGADTDQVAYVGISAAGISRTAAVHATLPALGGPSSFGNGQTGENDAIASDVEGLIGGNGNDTLTGNNGPNTIAGSAPPGTPDVNPQPAGTQSVDTINGAGGNDQLVAGDSGTVNGGDGNDTLVGGRSFANRTVLNGGNNDDTIVSGIGSDEIFGGAGSNTLAYVSVNQGSLKIVDRGTNGVLVQMPETGGTGSGGRIGGQEKDIIHDDVQTLIGSNGSDFLIGSNHADTIVGAAPVGTGNGVVESPAGNDTIFGRGGDDTIVGGDSGSIGAGDGNDTIVGGRSTAAGVRTVIHGNAGNDTIVSGLGNDEIFGDAGSNTLAYASVQQSGINIVDRGTKGVSATLPNAGQTATGGTTGGAERDIIHADISTLVGSNGNDVLQGNDLANTIVGVAPAGTAGVRPGPAGNDVLSGGGGPDFLLGAEGNDWLLGGAGNDVMLGGDGSDVLVGGPDADTFSSGAGDDRNLARDGVADSITCGTGTDSVTADTIDKEPAGDCENVSAAIAAAGAQR
jgi:Ca2+-binding RTX toxin-like protein